MPRLEYNIPSTINPSGIKESIRFTSSPYKKGNRNNKEFTFSIYVPVEGGVSLNKKYEIKPINGTGYISFTHFDDSSLKENIVYLQ